MAEGEAAPCPSASARHALRQRESRSLQLLLAQAAPARTEHCTDPARTPCQSSGPLLSPAMPESQPLPLASSLSDVYTPAALEHEKQRWADLFDGFKREFGAGAPQKVARAPGRVNIIGAHPSRSRSRDSRA